MAASSNPASADMAEHLSGAVSAREVVLTDPSSGVRWFEHDYPTQAARWNHHPEYELHLIRSGTGRLLVGDHMGRFEAGHLALIGPNLPHDWISDLAPGETIPNRDVVLQFDGDRLRDGIGLFPELEELPPLLDMAARGVEFTGATARFAAEAMESLGRTHGLARLARLLDLFAMLARAPETDRTLLASPFFAATVKPEFEAVAAYVMGNIDRDIRMSEAARIAGLTESTFSRTFRRLSGHNFVDFVRKLRVAQACRLLRQTDTPISAICFDVGFGTFSNFNRQFRAETGMSPSAYRRDTHPGDYRPCS